MKTKQKFPPSPRSPSFVQVYQCDGKPLLKIAKAAALIAESDRQSPLPLFLGSQHQELTRSIACSS